MSLEDYFRRHCHRPTTDSSVVRTELESLLKKHRRLDFGKQVPLKAQAEGNDSEIPQFSTLDYLKYVARKHGLPRGGVFQQQLIGALHDDSSSSRIPLRNRFQVALCLKYALLKDGEYINIEQCIRALKCTAELRIRSTDTGAGNWAGAPHSENHNSDELTRAICSQIMQCVIQIIQNESSIKFDAALVQNLAQFVGHVDATTKASFLKAMKVWEEGAGLKATATSGDPSTDDVSAMSPTPDTEDGMMQFGGGILTKASAAGVGGGGAGVAVADAVKTQQIMTSNYKQNISEKDEIEAISLAKALSTGRTSSVGSRVQNKVSPGQRPGSGSHRGWLSTTGGDITTLTTRAEGGQLITEDDVVWLVGKTDYGVYVSNTTMTLYELTRVTKIFQLISKYQRLEQKTINALAHNFFSERLDSSYENARLNLMHAFETHVAKSGCVPEKMANTLLGFKKEWTSMCTAPMRRIVWRILAKDEANLEEAFSMALKQLGEAADEETEKEALEFVGAQVVFEKQAKRLNELYNFVERLLKVVVGDKLSLSLRIAAAEIIEDFLSFEGEWLSAVWQSKYLALYNELMEMLEPEDERDEDSEIVRLQIVLMRSVLRNFDKLTTFANVPKNYAPPNEDTIRMLVDMCTESGGNKVLSVGRRKLEALIAVTLGNLVSQCKSMNIRIPDAYKLAYKLVRADSIDENGHIVLEDEIMKPGDGDQKGVGDEEQATKAREMSSDARAVQISSIVANIFLSSCTGPDTKPPTDSYFALFFDALNNSSDKTTRILCAETLAQLSTHHALPAHTMHELRYLVTDPVIDVQVHATVAYCQVARKNATSVTREDLNWISKLYVVDHVLMLGDKNHATAINDAVLHCLGEASGRLEFTEEVYQLLTVLLQQGGGATAVAEVMAMIRVNVLSLQHPRLPRYTFEVIEEILVSNCAHFDSALELLVAVARILGTHLAPASIDTIHQTFQFQKNSATQREQSFRALVLASNNQEVATHIFQDLDMQIMAMNLQADLECTPNSEDWRRGASATLQSILEYQRVGRLLSNLNFSVLATLMTKGVCTEEVVECLVQAAENKQGLPGEVTKAALDPNWHEKGGEVPLQVLALASTLASKYQTLPQQFLASLVQHFDTLTSGGCDIGDSEEYDRMLFILAKLAQNKSSAIPESGEVAHHFCILYMNSSAARRKRFGITMKLTAAFVRERNARSGASPEAKMRELLGRFCSFWKKSHSLHHRLEILAALQGFAAQQTQSIESSQKKQQQKIHSVFMNAIQDPNARIVAKGLDGFIALNWNGAPFCVEQDFQALASLLCHTDNKDNIRMRDRIWKFLRNNETKLPPSLKQEIQLLERIEKANDSQFLQVAKLMHTKDAHAGGQSQKLRTAFLQSQEFSGRLESIIRRDVGGSKSRQRELCTEALLLCEDLAEELNDARLFEAVGVAMVMADSNSGEVQAIGLRIFEKLARNPDLSSSALVTDTLLSHLSLMPINNIKSVRLVLRMLAVHEKRADNRGEVPSAELRRMKATFQLQRLLFRADEYSRSGANTAAELDAIELTLIDSLDNSDTIRRLVAFLITQTSKISAQQRTALLELLFRSILKNETAPPDSEVCAHAGRLVEEELRGKKEPSVTCLAVFQALIENGHTFGDFDLTAILEALAAAFWQPAPQTHSLKSKILACISSSICSEALSSRREWVPFVAVQLLLDQLRSEAPELRETSVRALTTLKAAQIASGDAKLDWESPMSPSSLQTLTHSVFDQIFREEGEEDARAQELDKDPEFAFELIKLLYSLRHWDFACLRPVKDDRALWRQNLITSDFLETHCTSESGKLEAALSLTKIFQQFDGVAAEGLVLQLRRLLNDKEDESFVLRVLDVVAQFEDVHEVRGILAKLESQDLHNHDALLALQTQRVEKCLRAICTSFSVYGEILHLYALKLVALAGAEFALALVRRVLLGRPKDVSELDELLVSVNRIKDKSAFQSKQFWEFVFGGEDDVAAGKATMATISTRLDSFSLFALLPPESPVFLRAEPRLHHLFTTLLSRTNISVDQVQEFLLLALKRSGGSDARILPMIDHVLAQCVQYQYAVSSHVFRRILSSLGRADQIWNAADVYDTVNRVIDQFSLNSTEDGLKSVEQIFQEFLALNPQLGNGESDLAYQTAEFCKMVQEVQEGRQKSHICLDAGKLICEFDSEDVGRWAQSVRQKRRSGEGFSDEEEKEAFMVIKHAFLKTTNFHMTPIQLLSCIASVGTGASDEGLLLQVVTGSGKSAIIGFLAAYQCLVSGRQVDVYTSSSVLAERDAKEMAPFYAMLGLSCDHNADLSRSYVCGVKGCYVSDIVYGDCAQFQFDFLRHAYSDLGTRGGRSFDNSLAIFDEVDAACIDDSSKLARLSSTLPGMDTLHFVYFAIWDRLCFLQSHLFQAFHSIFYLEGQIMAGGRPIRYVFMDAEGVQKEIDDLLAFIVNGEGLEGAKIHLVHDVVSFVERHLVNFTTALITDKEVQGFPSKNRARVSLPSNLQYFAESQIEKWVQSGMTALAYQENVHYVVAEGRVKPVDFSTTGIVHSSTNWNNGLHQFLQIKHNLRLDSESVTTNFLSTTAIFCKYESRVVGLTGTLGSEASKRCLRSVYKVGLLLVPEMFHRRFQRFPDYVANSEADWLAEIVRTTVQETNKRRGVLVICETIKQAERVAGVLEGLQGTTRLRIKMYTRNAENQEKGIQQVHPGDVVVATNLAGRGTDIKTTVIEKYGGLHVCLTFLPASMRVEEQAFGRTSRQGKKGSGQLILFGQDGPSGMSSEERNAREEKALLEFEETRLPLIRAKDKLFHRFLDTFNRIRSAVRAKHSGNIEKLRRLIGGAFQPAPSFQEVVMLAAVEERWAMFLKRIDDGSIAIEKAEAKFIELEAELRVDDEMALLSSGGTNAFYLIQLGNHEFRTDSKLSHSLDKAQRCFEKAMKVDEEFAAGAFVGKAYCLLKGHVNILLPDGHADAYKEDALALLQRGRKLLYDEMATVHVIQAYIRKNGCVGAELHEPIGEQATERINLLGSYLKTVGSTIEVIQKSLRQVQCSIVRGSVEEVRAIPDSIIQTTKCIPEELTEKCDTFHLTFHDLTVRKDSGFTHDQLLNTMMHDGWKEAAKKLKNKLMNKMVWRKHEDKDGEVQFSRCVSCVGVNPNHFLEHEIAKTESLLEKLSLEIEGLESNFDLACFGSGCGVKSFAVEFVGFPSALLADTKFQQILKKHLLNKVGITITLKGSASKASEELTLIETLSTKEFENQVKRHSSNNVMLTIAFSNLKHEGLKLVIARVCKEAQLNRFNLTLKKFVKLKEAQKLWTEHLEVKCTQNSFKLHFESLNKGEAEALVPILRELGAGGALTLRCRNLSLDTAQLVLGSADIGQEHILLSNSRELSALYMADNLPLAELRDLGARGLTLIVTFNERKFVPWISIAGVVGLASLQAVAGGVLVCTGFGATVGMGLITESMADLVQAQRIYTTREFSWSSYGLQKSVSLVISAASMGLSSLKDGAKGAALAVEGAVKEVVEQAGTSVVVKQMTLNATIEVTGANLTSLVVKHVATSVVETGAKIAIKEVAKSMTDFCFEQARAEISKKVGIEFETRFRAPSSLEVIRFYWALDKTLLTRRVHSIVSALFNPKVNGWVQVWNSVGTPLINGILSSPQFLGSVYTQLTMIYGVVTGLKEIVTAIEKVCQEIEAKLREERPTCRQILQSYCRLPQDTLDSVFREAPCAEGEEIGLNFELNAKLEARLEPQHLKTVLKSLALRKSRRTSFALLTPTWSPPW